MKIPPEISTALSKAEPDETFCFVLEWDEGAAIDQSASAKTRQEKRLLVSSALREIKAPVLDSLRNQPQFDVNDLEGTGQAVVAAPARGWRKLFKNHKLKGADLRVLPNELFHAH